MAMPRGAVSGFGEAVDFAETVGVAHHPEYYNATSDVTTAISRAQELGIRHFRLGLWTPASQVNMAFKTGPFGLAMNNAGLFALWGSAEEPQYRATINGEVAKYGGTNDTFYRMLSGPAGSTTTTFWPSNSSYYPNEKKWGNSQYYAIGWETAAGFQGPNEPKNFRNPSGLWFENSIRNDVMRPMMAEKALQATREVMGGAGWINHTTGKFETGPAYASQLPVVAPPMGTSDPTLWNRLGDYTNGDTDVGSINMYWGGHEPLYRDMWGTQSGSQWYAQLSYNGALSGQGRFSSRQVPMMMTETGYIQDPAGDGPPGGQRYCPPEVAGIYINRQLLHNYFSGICLRTFIFEFNHPPFNICEQDWTRRASFYQIKNLMTLVGRGQGTGSVPPLTISGFTPGPNNVSGAGNSQDRLQAITLRQANKTFLRIVSRDRSIWNRNDQTRNTVADPQTLTMAVPAGSTVERALPELNPILNPDDGLTYPNTSGTNYQPMTVDGSNNVTFDIAALTQVFRVVVP